MQVQTLFKQVFPDKTLCVCFRWYWKGQLALCSLCCVSAFFTSLLRFAVLTAYTYSQLNTATWSDLQVWCNHIEQKVVHCRSSSWLRSTEGGTIKHVILTANWSLVPDVLSFSFSQHFSVQILQEMLHKYVCAMSATKECNRRIIQTLTCLALYLQQSCRT